MISTIFQPNVLDWLFGAGIGTNIGAAIVWGGLAGFASFFVGRFLARKVRAAWADLHKKLDAHHDERRKHLQLVHSIALDTLHGQVAHDKALIAIQKSVEELHAKVDEVPKRRKRPAAAKT